MKKTFAFLFLLLVALAGSITAEAQRGEKSLGIAGGYAGHNDGGYADIYFQYTIIDHIRIAPEIGYVFANKGLSGFEMSVDVQFPFRLARGFNIYPMTGVTFNSWSPRGLDSYSRVGVDFGAGFDIYLTRSLKLNLQGKYSLLNDCSGVFIGMGIAYVF